MSVMFMAAVLLLSLNSEAGGLSMGVDYGSVSDKITKASGAVSTLTGDVTTVSLSYPVIGGGDHSLSAKAEYRMSVANADTPLSGNSDQLTMSGPGAGLVYRYRFMYADVSYESLSAKSKVDETTYNYNVNGTAAKLGLIVNYGPVALKLEGSMMSVSGLDTGDYAGSVTLDETRAAVGVVWTLGSR